MTPHRSPRALAVLAGLSVVAATSWATTPSPRQAPGDRLVAWNDLGMHCIDPDFSVFSILPPYNTINAQLVLNEQLVEIEGNLHLTYEAVADATGSINTTSIGKTNFWQYVLPLFGVNLPPDVGLTGSAMPGAGNVPQPMHFDGTWDWFQGEGIPLTPVDDALEKNPYPLMRIVARNGAGQEVASTITVAPNSQELECRRCHGSGASPYAKPSGGWAFDTNPLTDDRWNILRLHDELEGGTALFTSALATVGYDAAGLEATALGGTPILCASCHGTNALGAPGVPGISAMSVAMHAGHADEVNASLVRLGDIEAREGCYVCHPGFDTQCLRGAMGRARGHDGQFSMACQSCHGGMEEVGDPTRIAWFEEPGCANCHTGSATNNNGEIRYTSAIDPATGELRVPVSNLFATTPDVPAPGFSLYRFSSGHGGLQCSACHGPPHAIYPTDFANDNAQNIAIQGHAGTLTDCTACHANLEDDEIDGPHGMHPVSQKWVQDIHGDEAEHGGSAQCFACHGLGGRGSVLSRAQGDRTYNTQFGQKHFWEGFEVSCYACHNGPNNDHNNSNTPPSAPDVAGSTPADVPLATTLNATDANNDPLTYRVVSQPDHGSVGVVGNVATWYPEPGFTGVTSYTYAAWDGDTNSNLATVTVTVTSPLCGATSEAYGFGCPGDGGFIPTLHVDGCGQPGDTVTITIANASGGKTGFVIVGNERFIREPWGNCILRVNPLLEFVPYALSPGGAGEGTASLQYAVPASVPAGALTFQAYLRDFSQGTRGIFTNAWELKMN